MGPVAVLLFALATLFGTSGCALGRAMVAPQSDYEAYRRYRTAETLEQRLTFAWWYLQTHEDGVYQPPVRTWFDRAEPVYWAVQARSGAGLEGYLRTLGNGPHAAEALERLMQRRLAERVRTARRTGAEEAIARIAADRSERERVAGLPLEWLRLLLDPTLWHSPFDDGPGLLLSRWRYQPPRPVCFWDELSGVHRCTKSMSPTYSVVADGEVELRSFVLSVELELDVHWRLRAARIFGPELFLHAAEALARRPLGPSERVAAAGSREALQQGAIRRADEVGLECDERTSLGRWALECDTIRLALERGGDGEDDVIVLTP